MASRTSAKTQSGRTTDSRYRKARRKRRLAKQIRRFEAVLPGGLEDRLRLPRLELPGFSLDRYGWSGWHWPKAASALLLAASLTAMGWVMTDYHWFVYADTVSFQGATYLADDELYPLMDVEGWSIFWVTPDAMAEQLRSQPYVADAQVRVGLSNRIQVTVAEVQPAALWIRDDDTYWLLDDGTALAMRTPAGADAERALLDADGRPLPQIIDMEASAQAVTETAPTIDPGVMTSALALLERFPALEAVRYNRGIGLNFGLPDGEYWVYWGDGSHPETKLEHLAVAQELLRSGAATGRVIDVRPVLRPYIR